MTDVFDLAGSKPDYTPLALESDFDPTEAIGSFDGTGANISDQLYRSALGAGQVGGLAVSSIASLGGQDAQDAVFDAVVAPLGRKRQAIDDDAYLRGEAAKVIGGVVGFLPNLALGPVGAGVVLGVGRTTAEVEDGRSLGDAAALGAVEGITAGLGIAAPAFIGKTLAQRLASGVGVNVGLGVGQRGAEGGITGEDAGVFDPTNLVIDATLGGIVAGGAHLYRTRYGDDAGPAPEPIPTDIADAASSAAVSRTIDARSPVVPEEQAIDIARSSSRVITDAANGQPVLDSALKGAEVPEASLRAQADEARPVLDEALREGLPGDVRPEYGPIDGTPEFTPEMLREESETAALTDIPEDWGPVDEDGNAVAVDYAAARAMADKFPDLEVSPGVKVKDLLDGSLRASHLETGVESVAKCILGAVNG